MEITQARVEIQVLDEELQALRQKLKMIDVEMDEEEALNFLNYFPKNSLVEGGMRKITKKKKPKTKKK